MINAKHQEITDEDIKFMVENKPRQLSSLSKYIHKIINYRIWEKDDFYLIETCHGLFSSGRGTILEKVPKNKNVYEEIKNNSENTSIRTGWLEDSNEHYFNYVWNGKKYDYVI